MVYAGVSWPFVAIALVVHHREHGSGPEAGPDRGDEGDEERR
jgi:hypothetical protein